jgi:hypothetical protein
MHMGILGRLMLEQIKAMAAKAGRNRENLHHEASVTIRVVRPASVRLRRPPLSSKLEASSCQL